MKESKLRGVGVPSAPLDPPMLSYGFPSVSQQSLLVLIGVFGSDVMPFEEHCFKVHTP